MASGEACGCDEVQRLRAENARLTGVIEGMREGMALAGRGPHVPDLVVRRCSARHIVFGKLCELPAYHDGEHRLAAVRF